MKRSMAIFLLANFIARCSAVDFPCHVDDFVSENREYAKIESGALGYFSTAYEDYRVDALAWSGKHKNVLLVTTRALSEESDEMVDRFNETVDGNAYFVQPYIYDLSSEIYYYVLPAPAYYNISDAKTRGANIFSERQALEFVHKLLSIAIAASNANLIFGGLNASQLAISSSNEPYVYLYVNLCVKGKQIITNASSINDPYYSQIKNGEFEELDEKIDVWGIGEVLYSILAQGGFVSPINLYSLYPSMNNTTTLNIHDNLSIEVLSVLDAALKFNPSERVTLAQLNTVIKIAIETQDFTYTVGERQLLLGQPPQIDTHSENSYELVESDVEIENDDTELIIKEIELLII